MRKIIVGAVAVLSLALAPAAFADAHCNPGHQDLCPPPVIVAPTRTVIVVPAPVVVAPTPVVQQTVQQSVTNVQQTNVTVRVNVPARHRRHHRRHHRCCCHR